MFPMPLESLGVFLPTFYHAALFLLFTISHRRFYKPIILPKPFRSDLGLDYVIILEWSARLGGQLSLTHLHWRAPFEFKIEI